MLFAWESLNAARVVSRHMWLMRRMFFLAHGVLVWVSARVFEVGFCIGGEDTEGTSHWPVGLCAVVELFVFWWGWEGSP